jgi:ribosomal protein S18 acetylase RimI-like enzyme
MRDPRDAASGPTRCAIYTRKSTEEGLDQDFNSLDAQREACAAYILSQRHEGWIQVPGIYEDGGFSGGNMERPGLRRLLAAIAAGQVDVIVVYKVDRLTRSLADFAKMVDILDGNQASFVSVTQAFNTTTSMGLRERIDMELASGWALFVAERDHRIVGMLALKPRDAILDQIFVLPEDQASGAGKALLDLAKEKMPAGFCLRMASANVRAGQFYERSGLVIAGQGSHPISAHPVSYYRWNGS